MEHPRREVEQGGTAIDISSTCVSVVLDWGYLLRERSYNHSVFGLRHCRQAQWQAGCAPVNYHLELMGGREQDIVIFLMPRLDLRTGHVCVSLVK